MNYMGVEMPSRFTEFGGMIISGLVNGITNAMGAVKTAITNAGSNTVDWFKEKLGIHSPSRVFAELGGFTMAGLAQGVAEGQSGPLEAVKAVGDLMTQAGTVTMSAITNAGAALNPAASAPGAKAESGGMLDSIIGMGKRLAQVGAIAVGMGGAQGAIAVDNRPPIGAAAAPAAMQMAPDQIVINIHPAPGMDAAAIARAVSAELDKRQHAKQAKGRSALFDQE
jgi:hypothetical protein